MTHDEPPRLPQRLDYASPSTGPSRTASWIFAGKIVIAVCLVLPAADNARQLCRMLHYRYYGNKGIANASQDLVEEYTQKLAKDSTSQPVDPVKIAADQKNIDDDKKSQTHYLHEYHMDVASLSAQTLVEAGVSALILNSLRRSKVNQSR